MIDEQLRREIVCAQINVRLARSLTHMKPSAKLAEIEFREQHLNDLLEQL